MRKKIITMLLVVLMTFSFCTACKDSSGRGTNNVSLKQTVFSVMNNAAENYSINATFKVTLNFEQDLFSADALAGMMGGDVAIAANVLNAFAAYIKGPRTVEIPLVISGILGEKTGRISVALGAGSGTLKCSMIYVDENVYFNVKELYTSLSPIMSKLNVTLPVWPTLNEYVSLMDIDDLLKGNEKDIGSDIADVTADAQKVALTSLPGTVIMNAFGFGELAGMTQLLERWYAVLAEIPESSIGQLMDMIETGLCNANVLTNEDGYLTFRLNGNNLPGIPGKIAEALDGKLSKVLEEILTALSNSSNAEFAAAFSAILEDFDAASAEDELIEMLQQGMPQYMVDSFKEVDLDVAFGVKSSANSIALRFSMAMNPTSSEPFARVSFSADLGMTATSTVSVTAPTNVLTKVELMDLIAMSESVERAIMESSGIF